MGKIAFVFPGQGAQYSGMGHDFYDGLYDTKEIFDLAENLKAGTLNKCFYSDEDVLAETQNTQPCLYTVEMAVATALAHRGIIADVAAGFSLGELSALTYANTFSFEEGFKLVCKRGELMKREADLIDTCMAAVLKLEDEQVEKICKNFHGVYPVNYNCTGQISVSGKRSEMKKFKEAVREAGGKVIDLKVSGGFHSCFMDKAAADFKLFVENMNICKPEIPVYSNYSGKEYGKNIKETLVNQITNPVKWKSIIGNMLDDGVSCFIEVGPGRSLSSMIKRIDKGVSVLNVEDKETLRNAISKLHN